MLLLVVVLQFPPYSEEPTISLRPDPHRHQHIQLVVLLHLADDRYQLVIQWPASLHLQNQDHQFFFFLLVFLCWQPLDFVHNVKRKPNN